MPSVEDGTHKKVGVGIQGMHERVKQFCGGFEVRSDKNGNHDSGDGTGAEFFRSDL
jgi:signal transduction histidine kinase